MGAEKMRTGLALSILCIWVASPTQRVEEWTLRENLRLDARGDTSALARVTRLLVAPDGDVVVIDGRERGITRFDSAGRLVSGFGRRGREPGEFESIAGAGFLGDTLWVSDGVLGRVTMFAEDDRVVHMATQRFDPGSRLFIPGSARAMLASGTAVAQAGLTPEALLRRDTLRAPLVRLSRSNRVLDTLAMLPLGHPVTHMERGGIYLFSPFDDGPLWQGDPEGRGITLVLRTAAASTVDAAFVVRRFDADGELLFERRIPYEPVTLDPWVADSVVADGARRVTARNYPGVDIPGMVRAGLFIPATLPPVVALVAGRDGTTWIEREHTLPGLSRWDVLDERGTPIGRLTVPRTHRILVADRAHVWALTREGGRGPAVVRFGVSRARGVEPDR
jgi:hypothetical protein